VALPGFDEEWFATVDLQSLVAGAAGLDQTRMRTCAFTFTCDCSAEKLAPFFRALGSSEINELFGEDPELIITCPRCGRRMSLSRSTLMAEGVEPG